MPAILAELAARDALGALTRLPPERANAALAWFLAEHAQPERLLTEFAELLRARSAALVEPRAEGWAITLRVGSGEVPLGLAADAVDRMQPCAEDSWAAVALLLDATRPSALLIELPHAIRGAPAEFIDLAKLWEITFRRVRTAARQSAQLERLETVLALAQEWNRHREEETLLADIAAAAARLLNADRASIFLWDRALKQLVGRPALGVPGGELRVPDDRGVVGQVLRTGTPARVEARDHARQIDHAVDRKLGYQTRSLLCVPMIDGKQTLGVFEVLNRREGDFNDDDQSLLVELARHAATAVSQVQTVEALVRNRRNVADEAAGRVQLVGESPAMRALRDTIGRVAETDLGVLILGENGTGKEVVCQAIHYASPRREQALVAVNCAAISESLLESELFGHEKGAFTDAHEARAGKFELAAQGTLFLDEIGDMSLAGQAKLLRVLEEKVVVRVGGSRPIATDARVIVATNQNLAQLVQQKKFRQDLFYRLSVVTLELPPLRLRRDDILVLAEHFLARFAAKARRSVPALEADARQQLIEHPWPGNVRELRNLMERLAYLHAGETITAADLTFPALPGESPSGAGGALPLAEATEAFQSAHIRAAIEACDGNMSAAAQRLGLHRSNLYRKMQHLGMPTP